MAQKSISSLSFHNTSRAEDCRGATLLTSSHRLSYVELSTVGARKSNFGEITNKKEEDAPKMRSLVEKGTSDLELQLTSAFGQ